MRNPRELSVFAKADELALDVYRVTTQFPSEERFNLTSQIRRAAVSVPSNLVEGCSRESHADFRRFVVIALGSAMELEYQLGLAERIFQSVPVFGLGGLAEGDISSVKDKALEVAKMLNGFVRSLRSDT